jgi:hypothetical protein
MPICDIISETGQFTFKQGQDIQHTLHFFHVWHILPTHHCLHHICHGAFHATLHCSLVFLFSLQVRNKWESRQIDEPASEQFELAMAFHWALVLVQRLIFVPVAACTQQMSIN